MIRILAECEDEKGNIHTELHGNGKQLMLLMSALIHEMARETENDPKVYLTILTAITLGTTEEYKKAIKLDITDFKGIN